MNLELAREVAGYFRVAAAEAQAIVVQVKEAVSNWQAVATEMGISRGEQAAMSSAFRVTESGN